MSRLRGWLVLPSVLVVAIGVAGCGDEGSGGGTGSGLPVGSACTASPECSGPGPDCLQSDIQPLATFLDSPNDAARELGEAVVIPMPDSYCSNTTPCETDGDCGDGGRCFLPLVDVDADEYASLVAQLQLSEDEEATLVGFHDYGQCLKPCETNGDCTRQGYHCAVPLESFLVLVEDMGARMETYCIGEPSDPCDPNPCDHGTCVGNAEGTFSCDCETGWSGELCDIEDPCEPNPCDRGTCTDNGDGTFGCECETGWTGELCDQVDPCEPDPCDHGTCTDNGDGTFGCECESGWIGELCDSDDPCEPNPCLHNGTCNVQDGSAVCTDCDPGWSGDLCEVPHDCGQPPAVSPPLQMDTSEGTLLGDTVTYSCEAGYNLVGTATRTCTATGWGDSEPICEPEPITCGPDTCNGHGTCVEQGGVFDHCDCDPGWTGETCGTEVDCGAPQPPANGGVAYTTTTHGSTATYSCDSGYDLVGSATVTCQTDGTWSDAPPSCDPVDCGTPDPAPANGSLSHTTTTYGSTATYSCDAGYGLVGAETVTCQADGTWSGSAPTCEPLYCDVVYQLTGTFRVSDAPQSCGDVSNTMQTNATLPSFENGETTPFNPTDFTTAFIRLRFPEAGGSPGEGDVALIEYYLPVEFLVDCTGTDVTTDVDHSVGLLEMSGTPPEVHASPGLSRPCQPWATGQLSGTNLDWSACDVVPPASGNWWSHDDAQAGAGDTTTACAMRMSVWGNVTCSGWFCGFVPNLGNQLNTWDQLLNSFVFSGTDYSTATFSMSEVQVPESTSESDTRTWVTIDSATPIHVECGAISQLTCDEVAP